MNWQLVLRELVTFLEAHPEIVVNLEQAVTAFIEHLQTVPPAIVPPSPSPDRVP